MTRSREEVISEMVDSGLFSDDEIRTAVAHADKPAGMSLRAFGVNAGRDALANIQGQTEVGAYALPPLALMKAAGGQNIYDPQRLRAIGAGAIAGVADIPRSVFNTVRHPVKSFYERPFSAASDISTAYGAGAGVANVGRKIAGATARKILPGMVRSSAGIPEALTERALAKPPILERPPVPETALNAVVGEPIIAAMQAAKKAVGERFGKIFQRYAGMEGPMQEIVKEPAATKLVPVKSEVPVAQKLVPVEVKRDVVMGGGTDIKLTPGDMITESKVTGYKPGKEITIRRPKSSYNELLVNKNKAKRAFLEGDTEALKDLYQRYVGSSKSDYTPDQITAKDKAQILTRLKRDAQKLAKYNKAPTTNVPIDAEKDAAFKSIAGEIDAIRADLPGGGQLELADKAWSAIHDIFDTIQNDLKDPGKSKDTMMRIARGDSTWLTSGRMKGKVDAIREVEKLTNSKLLEPAMEELARQVFSQDMGTGHYARNLRVLGTGMAGFAGGKMSLPMALGSVATLAMTSPKLIGKAIVAGSKLGAGITKIAPGALKGAGLAAMQKVISQEGIREYLRQAKGDKAKAREMIKKDKYVIPK